MVANILDYMTKVHLATELERMRAWALRLSERLEDICWHAHDVEQTCNEAMRAGLEECERLRDECESLRQRHSEQAKSILALSDAVDAMTRVVRSRTERVAELREVLRANADLIRRSSPNQLLMVAKAMEMKAAEP